MMEAGSVISRDQCPKCKDSGQDNLITWDNGTSKCFGCGYSQREDYEVVESPRVTNTINGISKPLNSRGISKDTCKIFNYQIGNYSGKLGNDDVVGECVHIANYLSDSGELNTQKLRASKKRMKILGDASKLNLYGRWIWEPNKKLSIIITEGELDTLSVYEMYKGRVPVVSIPCGAAAAVKYIKLNLEWLEKFSKVVFCFDSDEQGIKAAKECAEKLAPGSAYICNLPEKDANDMLTTGKIEEFKKCILNAKPCRPDSIVGVEDLTLDKPEYGISWPWKTLTKITYGMQEKSIYTIGAGSGIGKTEFLKDIILHLTFKENKKVGAIFLEQSPADTLKRLIGGMIGERLHIPGTNWDEGKIKECQEKLKEKIYFYDHFGGQDLDSIVSKIRYLANGLDCKVIVLDHLTALAAEMVDDRKGIDKAMARLGSLTQELGITLFLVSHLAKPIDGTSYEEGKRVTASAFRGSQSIQYWSSFMIGLERDKLADDESQRVITTVRVLKDRFSGEADGVTFYIKYNRDLGRLEEL